VAETPEVRQGLQIIERENHSSFALYFEKEHQFSIFLLPEMKRKRWRSGLLPGYIYYSS
jgi:hypothetical protein